MTSLRAPRPPVAPAVAFRNWHRAMLSLRTWHTLFLNMRHDRVLMRSSALAFDTLLSVVPLTAVVMAATRALGGSTQQAALLQYLAEQYVPASAGKAVDRILPLVASLDLRTIGIVGLVALFPVILSLVESVERALSDIFRTPRRNHWWRLLVLGGLLTLAPLGSLFTVRYVPWDRLAVDHVVTPLLLMSLLFYAVFRTLPSVQTSDRAALTGGITAALLLTIAKAGFGLYATHLSGSLHLLWGAIAFVPLLLAWVLLSWGIVLFGAELSATLQAALIHMEAPIAHRSHARRRTSRLGRRIKRRVNQSAGPRSTAITRPLRVTTSPKPVVQTAPTDGGPPKPPSANHP